MELLLPLWLWTDALEMRVSHRAAFTMREDYWCFKMKGIIAGVLIIIAVLIGVATLGFIQVVRAWSDIFR